MPDETSPPFPPYRRALVAELVTYARNARTHSDAQVAQIVASVREFGFTNPVLVDGERGVIAGHSRLLAARKLGMAEVPTIELSHLTPAQRRACILADNRLALSAGWDDREHAEPGQVVGGQPGPHRPRHAHHPARAQRRDPAMIRLGPDGTNDRAAG